MGRGSAFRLQDFQRPLRSSRVRTDRPRRLCIGALNAQCEQAEGARLRVRRACHCGLQADSSRINKGEKSGFRFLWISTLSKDPVSLDEGHCPRRQEQTGREMGDGIGRFLPYAFG